MTDGAVPDGSTGGSGSGEDKTGLDARQARNQTAIALELPFVLVGTVALGGLIGYFLDRSMHSKPIFLLIFGALGVVGGIREIIRRVK
jgi:F0F1-type ATP synthase assembly protein I